MGQKEIPSRASAKRDSGILYHFVGPDKIWPRSVDCQIQEGDTGDFWLLNGASLTTTIAEQEPPKYLANDRTHTQTNGRIIKNADHETPEGWTVVEVIMHGDRATHLVNGNVNNLGWNMQQPDPRDALLSIPLTSGRLLLQAEGAKVFYRNIQVRYLD